MKKTVAVPIFSWVIKLGLALLLISVPLFFIYYRGGGYFFSIYGQAKEALAQVVILVLFCAWILKMNSTGQFRLVKTPLNLPLTVLSLLMLASLLWAGNPDEGLKFIRRWVGHILLYFIVVNNIKTIKQIKAFISVMVLTAIVVAGYGIAQYYGWELPHLHQVLTHNATMGNPGFAGEYLVIVMPLALAMLCSLGSFRPTNQRTNELTNQRNKLKIILFYLMALGVFTHLIIARSRATWVGLAVTIAAMVTLSIKKGVILRPLVLNIVSIALITNLSLTFITPALVDGLVQRLPKHRAKEYALTTPGVVPGFEMFSSHIKARPLKPLIELKPSDPWWLKRVATIFNLAYGTNRQRLQIWKGTVEMIKARPFLGVGIGNFNLFYPCYQTEEALATYGPYHFIRQAHNEYLQFAAELGLPGLACFIWFGLVLVRGLWRRVKTVRVPGRNIIYLGLLGSVLAVLVGAAFSFNLQNESSSLYFWFVVGLAGVILRYKKV